MEWKGGKYYNNKHIFYIMFFLGRTGSIRQPSCVFGIFTNRSLPGPARERFQSWYPVLGPVKRIASSALVSFGWKEHTRGKRKENIYIKRPFIVQYVCRGSLARVVGLCYVCCSSVVVVSKLIQHQSRAITIIFVAHTVIFSKMCNSSPPRL